MAATATEGGDFVVSNGFPASGTYLSPVWQVGQSYNAAGSYWEVSKGDPTTITFELRGSKDGKNFSDWFNLSADNFEGPDHVSMTRTFGPLAPVNTAYVQFRLTIPSGVAVKLAGVTFIDTADGPTLAEVPVSNMPIASATKPYIISRADWGANEAWRYNGNKVAWPTEYRTIKASSFTTAKPRTYTTPTLPWMSAASTAITPLPRAGATSATTS